MHLDENDVARYVDGRIGEMERSDIEAHLAECPECSEQVAEAWAVLEELRAQGTPRVDPDVRRKAEALGTEETERLEGESLASRSAVVVGGLALLLCVVGLLFWQTRGPEPNQLRSSVGENVVATRAPADGARLSERPVFVSDSVPGALAYRVTLYAPDGTILWEQDTTVARVPLPADVSLTEGRTYLWRATALHSDGRELRSDLQTFTYAP